MKRRNRERVKRWLALVLCLSMVFPSTATFVSAAEEPAYTGGLCEHHPEHTAECGYAEAVEGSPCTYECSICQGVQMLGATEYSADSAESLEMVLTAIQYQQGQTEFVITLEGNISGSKFVGVEGKHITLKSEGDNLYSIGLGREIAGDITLDNVSVKTGESSPVYANGHLFETTENFPADSSQALIHTLYGGGNTGTTVESTNLVLNGGRFENVYGGGYDSAVTGNVNITMAGKAFVGNLYGGGHAAQTESGTVGGNVNLQLKSGTIGSFLGGGKNSYAPENSREPARVHGTVYLTAGYAGAPEGTIKLTNAAAAAEAQKTPQWEMW